MKTYNLLLSAVTASVVLTGVIPCGANASDGVRATSLELNKSVTRRVYEEGLNQGRFEVPYSADFVGHGGRANFTHADGMAEAQGWRKAFPDLKITVDKQVAERDLVAVRWTARGTNTGAGNGIPATGRAVQITGTTLFRMADGRIAEEWTCADSLGLMKQLGLHRQVLAVTHLPQVAACADKHLLVSKAASKGQVSSQVRAVTGEERVSEIARMLGGEKLSATTLAHAREMLGDPQG